MTWTFITFVALAVFVMGNLLVLALCRAAAKGNDYDWGLDPGSDDDGEYQPIVVPVTRLNREG